MYKHLFVPIDGSALSHRAMDGSIELALQLGAQITGFVVEPEVPLSAVSRNAETFIACIHEHQTANEIHSKALLAQFEARTSAAGVPFKGVSLTSDSVDRMIADEAEKNGCDLIVIVTHDRGKLGEFVFGSHAKRVISLTRLPVLVLH